MREFYVSETNKAIAGPLELDEAIEKISFYVSPKAKREALTAYANGERYEFNFSYGFNSATVSVWKDKLVGV